MERNNMEEKDYPIVLIDTTTGHIKVELWEHRAPITVKNFLRYVEESFYDGTIFHRVIDNFMIQGGGLTPDMRQKQSGLYASIKNEADTGLCNEIGTIAMARTQEINSATSQFFINVNDNKFLDHQNDTPKGFGYAVFGRVIEGMDDVVMKISKIKTCTIGPFSDVPAKPVMINSIKLL
jgi:peptidyl-prolyl cis-trans isomerase B (cyclophilin B)